MVRFDFSQVTNSEQDLDHIGLTDAEIVELANFKNALGYWRSDLSTGHVFWSSNIFKIYGMECTTGPVNLTIANDAVHPDDLNFMLELIERAASEKTGFHYVLRVRNGKNGFKYIRAAARYRVTADGREELYGMLEEIIDPVRQISLIEARTLA